MTLLDALLRELRYDCSVKDIRQGVFHTAVLTRRCGMAATLPKDALRQKPPLVAEPGALLDKDPEALAKLAHSASLLEAAIGMATINSLLPVDETTMVERNAGDILIEKGTGKNVTVIGHFPFLPQLRKAAAHLWVLENNPQEGDLGPEKAPEVLPQSDIVAITGTAITNHTFETGSPRPSTNPPHFVTKTHPTPVCRSTGLRVLIGWGGGFSVPPFQPGCSFSILPRVGDPGPVRHGWGFSRTRETVGWPCVKPPKGAPQLNPSRIPTCLPGRLTILQEN